jgi:hypothetical protein
MGPEGAVGKAGRVQICQVDLDGGRIPNVLAQAVRTGPSPQDDPSVVSTAQTGAHLLVHWGTLACLPAD